VRADGSGQQLHPIAVQQLKHRVRSRTRRTRGCAFPGTLVYTPLSCSLLSLARSWRWRRR
jgi:hypothetical protein